MWAFEQRLVANEDISKGPVSPKKCTILWLFLTFLLISSLYFTELSTAQTCLYITLAPILARLIALDLCFLVLPDIYTVPLIIVGINMAAIGVTAITVSSSMLAILIGGSSLLVLAIILEKLNKKANIGGGDIKMTAAAGAMLGITNLPIFLWLACAIAFILYPILKNKNLAISFGPALIIALWVMLAWPKLLDKAIDLLT